MMIVSAALLAGCGSRERAYPTGWESVNPEIDSLTVRMERAIINDENPDTAELLLSRMSQLSGPGLKNDALSRRVKLYRTAILNMRHEKDKAMKLLGQLRSEVDSAADPYLYNRIIAREWFIESEPTYRIHKRLLESIDYFESVGDSVTLACNLIHLSLRYLDVADYEAAIAASLRADTLLADIEYTETRLKNQVNQMVIYDCLGDTTMRNKLAHDLLKEIDLKRNTSFYTALLVNVASYVDDPSFLRQAYELIRNNPKYSFRQAIIESEIAKDHLDAGRLDSAQNYVSLALSKIPTVANLSHKREIYNAAYRLDSIQGDPVAALGHYRLMKGYEDSVRLEADPLTTARIQYQIEVEKERIEHDQKKRETRLLAVISVLLVAVAAGVVIIMLMLRSLRLKNMMMKANEERDRSYQKAALSMLQATEKETRLKDMAQVVADCESEGKIPPQQARTILSSLKANLVDSSGWNEFVEVFSRLHPNFEKELRQRYPSLSVKQIELCCYIRMGLDTTRIARLMSVKPETVWQNRWRLKQKMGLDSDESLQALLAGLAPDSD